MAAKLAINGFGRIGRTILRALMARPNSGLEVVAINDLAPLETCAHLFEFDSVHGRYNRPVSYEKHTLDVGNGPIRVTAIADPKDLPWRDVDIVLECTGGFLSAEKTRGHFANGAKRVLLSAPAEDMTKTVIFGINSDTIAAGDVLLSNASCTTNCLVPVAQVLDDAFGILRGHMTTVHTYTGSQTLHDSAHKDLYRARAAGLSMIPTTTGAAQTLGRVLPHLDGLLTGTAIRVPTPNVSCIDLVVETRRATSRDEINQTFQAAAQGPLKGILGITHRQLVSVDFSHDPHSAIFAADQTSVQQGTLVRVLAWYDNEWAFSNRMLDTAGVMAALL